MIHQLREIKLVIIQSFHDEELSWELSKSELESNTTATLHVGR